MDTSVHLARAISPLASGLLLASIWQGILLTAIVVLALRVTPSASPAARTRIWTGALLLILLLPLLEFIVPHTSSVGRPQLHLAWDWSLGLLALWVTVTVFRAASLGINALRLWRLAGRSTPLMVPPSVLPLLEGRRKALLCASAEVNRPSVAGFLHPRILLPQGVLETLSLPELEHVVLHEMEHLRRWDDWMNLLQQISLVLLPLNPALFWLDRRLSRERELACDDGVLASTQARRAYAACLVKLAEDSLVRKGLALALSALGPRGRESELVSRVRRILAGPPSGISARNSRLALSALGATALLAAALLVRSPQLVSFDLPVPAMVAQAADPGHMGFLPVSARMSGASPRQMMAPAVLEDRGPRALRAVAVRGMANGELQGRRKIAFHATRPFGFVRLRRADLAAGSPFARSVGAVAENNAGPKTGPGMGSEPSGVPMARVVVTEFHVSQQVFAAVPVRGGWLILQL